MIQIFKDKIYFLMSYLTFNNNKMLIRKITTNNKLNKTIWMDIKIKTKEIIYLINKLNRQIQLISPITLKEIIYYLLMTMRFNYKLIQVIITINYKFLIT